MAYNPGGGQPPFNPQYPYNAPPPPPPPKSGMGTGAKVALFGCLGLLILGIIGVVIAAIVGVALNKNSNTISFGNSNSNSNSSSSSNSNSSSNRNSGSSNKNSGSSTSKVHVDSLDLARDNNGAAGEHVSSFSPTDNPMHFVVGLSEFESGTKVRVVLMAVDVATGEKNVKVGEIERETSTLENQMDATMTLPRNWPTGTWRVDVYVNGSLDKSREFEVE